MTTTRDLPALTAALDAQSWAWLQEELPGLADALAQEVAQGATADELRRSTMRHTARSALAARVGQAAAHLIAQRRGQA